MHMSGINRLKIVNDGCCNILAIFSKAIRSYPGKVYDE